MSRKEPMSLVEKIEHQAGCRVGITVDENEALGKFCNQDQSLLFSVLPRELRDHIWSYCTAPFEDTSQPFAETEYYYRPGHTARLKTDTNILRTCRRIWLEANELPMLQAEHSFYYYRPAPEARNPRWLASLTEHNRLNFGHLHMFVQMYAIEGLKTLSGSLRHYFLHTPAQAGDFQPRLFHVTLRHTDWWYWESEAPLRLEDHWVQAMLDSPDLRSTQTFKLELETLDYKKDQLQPIVDRLRKMKSKEYESHLVDGKPAKTKFVLSEHELEQIWDGPTNINSNKHSPYADMKRLNYYGVTLTWNLVFPDIPRAFVPRLRREPRLSTISDTDSRSGDSSPYDDDDDDGDDDDDDDDLSSRPYYAFDSDRPYRPVHDLPYADESAHGHALNMLMKRHKKQQRKANMSGVDPLPPPDQAYFMMKLRSTAIRSNTKKQADDVENRRWKNFGRLMKPHVEFCWNKKGSLLKFINED